MQQHIEQLFQRYQQCFVQGIQDEADLETVAGFFAESFITAWPGGVMTGNNDDQLRGVMGKGFEHYRAMGMRDMAVDHVAVHPIDPMHCVASVAWASTFERSGEAARVVRFTVHYLIQLREGSARIFGWIAGDEEAELRAQGIMS
ncbi:nuclear transport factor 2 family protein [Cupriavidus sp. UGS-1]|uniref:DUF6841 family protein n=1 Tax=Cupriavidus sp. UGS-1 TaxID=2899826 RepID=UPI001E5B5835|nr:nuclear transport factor 2 family protein [Cupriavidus sp. UGS-1]MCD9123425.1 nuclear transport factor 2 family protein [Cupriavidus sp. UGS-1]